MEKKKIRKNVLNVIKYLLYLIIIIVLLFSLFVNKEFSGVSFEQLIYSITVTEGANTDIVYKGVIFVLVGIIIVIGLIFLVKKLYKMLNIKIYVNFGFKNKIKKYDIFKKTKTKERLFIIFLIIFTIIFSFKLLDINTYIKSQLDRTELFENYYVDGREVEIEFPEEKRNLIYIFVESLESSNATIENGGLLKESYTPHLEQMALENINFSNNDKVGGAYAIKNTTWTVAGMIAHTAGVPLKLSVSSNEYKNFGGSLPGAYNLGDILSDNGYKNYLMIGSDAGFGGRKDYFEGHGDYTIYDYNYAKADNWIDDDYYVWWGYEDQKLFEFAKKKIVDASNEDEPFNFTILTADTHFTDGYMDESCEEKFDSKYANSFYCNDEKIYNFINWIKEQDFYKNTTIVITGDHLTMQSDFYNAYYYDRTIYNTIINSAIVTDNEKTREFSPFDMFPTTLAAMGVNIEGNKLGLGVNLFSNEETLIEKFGLEYINEEIQKKSFYYDNNLLGDTYYKMKEEE